MLSLPNDEQFYGEASIRMHKAQQIKNISYAAIPAFVVPMNIPLVYPSSFFAPPPFLLHFYVPSSVLNSETYSQCCHSLGSRNILPLSFRAVTLGNRLSRVKFSVK